MFPRLRFYWVVAACGAVLMALEILSSRLLAPHYGNRACGLGVRPFPVA